MAEDYVDIWDELGIEEHKPDALDWIETAFPNVAGNEILAAQLYFTNVLEKTLPPPVDTITVDELKQKHKEFVPVKLPNGKMSRLYATVKVIMVQALENPRGYFGCPACTKGVNKAVGVCSNMEAHPGEEYEGETLHFQPWQAGDATGSIIVSFGPNAHQEPVTTQYWTLTLQGSMNDRDGTFSVWEVLSKKPPKVKKGKLKTLKKLDSKPKPKPKPKKVVVDESDEKTFDDPEEDTAAIFGTSESEGEDAGVEGLSRNGDFDFGFAKEEESSLVRDFKILLKRHFTEEANKFENMVRWARVRPIFLKWEKGEERDVAVTAFLDKMHEAGYFELIDGGKALAMGE